MYTTSGELGHHERAWQPTEIVPGLNAETSPSGVGEAYRVYKIPHTHTLQKGDLINGQWEVQSVIDRRRYREVSCTQYLSSGERSQMPLG